MTTTQERIVPSYIPQSAIQEARDHLSQGRVMEAWNVLAQAGDRYADNAAAVLGRNSDAADRVFELLVKSTWENTVGKDAYDSKFPAVARQHLSNYLDILQSGRMPTTQDIITSYESAARGNDLPPEVAIDGIWSKAADILGSSWGVALGLEPSRITTSNATNNLTPDEARGLIARAMGQTVNDLRREGRLLEAVKDLEIRRIQATWDYLGDAWSTAIKLIAPAASATANVLDALIFNRFGLAKSFVPRRDPLVLDLDGDGIETTGIDPRSLILFDHDGDSIATATGWVLPDDGFLAFDHNANGIIDNGTELFSDATNIDDGLLKNGDILLSRGRVLARPPARPQARLQPETRGGAHDPGGRAQWGASVHAVAQGRQLRVGFRRVDPGDPVPGQGDGALVEKTGTRSREARPRPVLGLAHQLRPPRVALDITQDG